VHEALCSDTCIDFENESSVAHISCAQSAKRSRCKTPKVSPPPPAISLIGCSLYDPEFKAGRNRRQRIFIRACVHVHVFVHACECVNECVELDVSVSICMYVYTHCDTCPFTPFCLNNGKFYNKGRMSILSFLSSPISERRLAADCHHILKFPRLRTF